MSPGRFSTLFLLRHSGRGLRSAPRSRVADARESVPRPGHPRGASHAREWSGCRPVEEAVPTVRSSRCRPGFLANNCRLVVFVLFLALSLLDAFRGQGFPISSSFSVTDLFRVFLFLPGPALLKNVFLEQCPFH